MNKLFLLLPLLLAACGTAPIAYKPQTVEVPVTVYCQTKDVAEPEMPFDKLAEKSMTRFEKTQLLAAQDKNLKGYVTELKGAIAGCKPPPK